MCHALAHARNSHTVTEQKVNSKTESTADADSKSKPQQHDAVTFFRLPTKSKESHARDWAKWKCERENELKKWRELTFQKSADVDVNVNDAPTCSHIECVLLLTRFTLVLTLFLSLWLWLSLTCRDPHVCAAKRRHKQQHTSSTAFTVCVCKRECACVCVCWLLLLMLTEHLSACCGSFWFVLAKRAEQQCN